MDTVSDQLSRTLIRSIEHYRNGVDSDSIVLEASVRKIVRRMREEPKRVGKKVLGSLSRKLSRKLYGV